MATQAAEAHDIEAQIAEAAIATEALARRIFGPAAYLRRDVDIDRETGEEEVVFEVHYCFDGPEHDFDRLAELHNAFTNAWVRATPPDVLSRVVLDAVPRDNPSEEASEMALQAAEAPEIEARIADAAVATEALARQIFGDAAYLRRGVHVDMESGDEDVAFEVHYCFPDPEGDFDRLVALNEAFMDAYVRTLSPDILCRIILKPIPTDAD